MSDTRSGGTEDTATNPGASLRHKNRSLRVFFRSGAALFFLALITANAVMLFNLYKALRLTDEVVEHSIVEMHHAMRLQMSLAQAAMPPNDYLIHGDPKARDEFQAHATEVGRNFETLAPMTAMTDTQHQVLTAARRDWEHARVIGEAILKTASPVGNMKSAAKMEEFDKLIENIITRLNAIHHVAHTETEESHKILHDLKLEATTVVLVFLAAGLAIAVAGFVLLNRQLFPPLQDLSRGMRLFSEGRHGHRIGGNMPVELRELAEGFNAMAANLQAQHAELVKTSTHDALTGCLNHRQFTLDFDREFLRVSRYQGNLSLLMVDLDNFKSVNDTYGHPAGDRVLQKVAEAMNSQLRASDTLYRYGGEEFVILLPETDRHGALTVAESIRHKVATTAIIVDDNETVTITVSIGVACFPQDTKEQEDLLKKADQAVYAAKNNGRNRVCHL
ncbi:diguanylate cyclase [Sulfuricaulis limicola]|uniref:diguanylate cyclase n=1 Tax=Sulfuricaulis limicola TaxID=1620215 RepID=A0A1B4XF68_9GAMM|nr:diguanylate cyclase [Sulfuricaulis limicola]BAV33445.1 diguanylate cyclase [Sulfuricaulis limicola]